MQVTELELDMSSTAIGKDFLTNSIFFDKAPSSTGYQFSIYGLLGLTLAKEEGFEINILGINLGINPMKLKVKLPGIGTLSAKY